MSYAETPFQSPLGAFAAQAAADERSAFITKTYLHLAGAIGLFVILEAVLLSMPGVEGLVQIMIGTRYGWLVVLGLFMVVSYVAENWAQSAVSPGMQYMGLGLYVVAEAVIFVPLLYVARAIDPGIILSAAVATLALFAVLTIFSTLEFYAEQDVASTTFTSIPAAMWWCIVTITTTGYGDMVPVTVTGRIIAGAAMLSGLALFSLLMNVVGKTMLASLFGSHEVGADVDATGKTKSAVGEHEGQGVVGSLCACGATIEPRWRLCPYCGKPLPHPTGTDNP